MHSKSSILLPGSYPPFWRFPVVRRPSQLLATLSGMPPRQSSSPLAAQLAELAETEAAALRERHKAREAAVRRYETARAKLEEAERSLLAGRDEQAAAVVALIDTGLDSTAVAQLLGIDARRVREARAAKRPGSPTASSPETN